MDMKPAGQPEPDRAPLKEVLGGQYTYRECCGSVIRIRAPNKWMAGARIQAHSTVERCINRALINRWGRMEGETEGG